MKRLKRLAPVVRLIAILAVLGLTALDPGATPPAEPSKGAASVSRPTVDEARERAKLLHGTIHDTLQIVHSRYYREDQGPRFRRPPLKLPCLNGWPNAMTSSSAGLPSTPRR